MIVACVALAVALGGVSYAATVLPRNSVGTLQLEANSVNSSKVVDGSLLRADFQAPARFRRVRQAPQARQGRRAQQARRAPRRPQGPSDAFSKSANGPIVVPAASATLTSLSIPCAGKYMMWRQGVSDQADAQSSPARSRRAATTDKSQSTRRR